MKKLSLVLASLMALDVLGFIAWYLSGQLPADGFYIGAITKAVLSIII